VAGLGASAGERKGRLSTGRAGADTYAGNARERGKERLTGF
jgi:hypothetical protein